MAGVTITPELLQALATLIAAVTALVSVFLTHRKVSATQSDVAVIKEQTNGTLKAVMDQNAALKAPEAPPPPAPPVPPAAA